MRNKNIIMNLLNFQLLLSSNILTNFADNMDVYFIMIVALAFLAIGDLVVGVSNDAVNFKFCSWLKGNFC